MNTADATKLPCFFFFSFTAQPAIFFHTPIPCLLGPPPPPPANQFPYFFVLEGWGGPGQQTLVSRAERICKLACTSASEASGNPIVRKYLFHDPPPSKQASKRTFSISVCMCCAAGVLGTGSVAQESGKGRSVKKN